jgi:putative lipoic acid-binding regulatory protein
MKQYTQNIESFKNQLENHYEFPADYLFKFIVPLGQEDKLKSLFPPGKISVKKSKTGKYLSISCKLNMESSSQIIDIYKEAYMIKGIISL